MGWRIEGAQLTARKCVITVAPHTSNWDFVIGFIASRAFDLPFPHWIGKESLFRGPMGPVMRAIGGIPVDRSAAANVVEQVAAEFAKRDHFIIGVTPEGTRGRTEYWKTGFYYIASRAQVPIIMGSMDYARKVVTFAPEFLPSGDIEVDFERIRAFYTGVTGRNSSKIGAIQIRPRLDPVAPAPTEEQRDEPEHD
ncbi:MAG: glycerol acyltransferase [Caldilineaceae bacterium]|nr:glycerol acyltransferase [Caldilineaceae bacterium]